jgi:hypothetical protein
MFHLIPSNICHPQESAQSGRLRRRAGTTRLIAGVAAIALLAATHTSARAAEAASRMAHEHHACAVVMGLHQPGDLYDTCIRSLDKTLTELDQGRLANRERIACAESGFTPGTRAFDVCVVTQNNN